MRNLFQVEVGFRQTDLNSDQGVDFLHGSGIPGGDASYQDAAAVGSVYQRTNGELYSKKTAGTGTDKWIRIATLDDITALSWRSEVVRAATAHADPGASHDIGTTPFSDDDAPLLTGASFAIGEYILYGLGGTVKLKEITNIVGDVLSLADAVDPVSNNDMFIVRNYLPDSPDAQEKQAICLYNGSAIVKISDFNWDIATGINISAGYSPASGDVNTSDTVESAIQKLDGVNDAQDTLLGTSQGALNLGTFPGDIISDNNTVKGALTDLETEVIRLDGQSSANGVTTAVVLDEVDVDVYLACKWELVAILDSAPANRQAFEIFAAHDGHSGGDAANVDDTVYAKLKLGSMASPTISIELSGAGASQKIQLKVANSVATSFRAKRVGTVEANGI